MFKSKSKRVVDEGLNDAKGQAELQQRQKSKKSIWGRKKSEPEPVPQVNLTAALPSSDNFRTSLLMPNLSARFSMLREQDDPNSMLGKASDDSVLHAHRKSKLGGFGDTGLSDIAEVASISSIRPPFASSGRSASYTTDASIMTDDESTHSGSIMSRARPGEGNVLFGGRQKIYKIPVGDSGSVKNLGSNEHRGMKGRALYEDDVHMSSFQKYREQEKQRERERRLAELEREMQNEDVGPNAMNSPSLSAYDEKRETTSSTNSGPSRMSGSTAATSVMSHGPPGSAAQSPGISTPQSAGPPSLQRSNSRRLYDTNLDHHMSEQQSAALTRMNSMQRKASSSGRSTPQYLTQSRSATNLRERFGPTVSSDSSRAASPLPPTNEKLTTFDSMRSPASNSPISPEFNDPENPLAQAVERADRGKATALGQFNRPKQFDEQQFLQRQKSLHQQRAESRSPRPPMSRVSNEQRRPSAEGRAVFPPRRPSEEARSRAGSIQSEQRLPYAQRPRAPTARSDGRRPSLETHAFSGTNRSDPSRPSVEGRTRVNIPNGSISPVAARNFHSATHSPMTGSPTKAGRREVITQGPPAEQGQPSSNMNQQRTAFYDSPVSPKTSNDESPLLGREQQDEEGSSPKVSLERGTRDDVPAPLRSPPQRSPPELRDHPALRSEAPPSPTKDGKKNAFPNRSVAPVTRELGNTTAPAIDVQACDKQNDSNPPSTNQLNGLIRSHLRHPSNVSSIYPNEDDRTRPSEELEETHRVSSVIDPDANPWTAHGNNEQQSSGLAIDNISPHNIGVAMSSPSEQAPSTLNLPPGPPNGANQLIQELNKQHTRDASTETQHERRIFAEDLQARQKAIQDSLRAKAENAQRGPSSGNVATKQNMFENGLRPLALLRKSSSREDMHKKKTGLGISSGSGTPNSNMRNGPPGSLRNGREPPVGRTLHMRMPEPRQSEDRVRSRSNSRPRKNSQASEQSSIAYRTPPDSSRTSTSTEGVSRKDASDSSSEIRRGDFPGNFHSTHPSARPSLETTRQRSDSSVTSRNVPPVPPLRTNNMAAPRPQMTSLGTNSTSQASTSSVSPVCSATNTPPLSAASLSSLELRGQTNTSLSQTPMAGASPVIPATLPPSTYQFPPRNEKDRPAAAVRRAGRSPTINKGDISQPLLISSTSNFETVELDEKRAQLQAMSIGNMVVPSPTKSPPAIPPMSPNRRPLFGRQQNESGRASPAVTENGTSSSTGASKKESSEEDDFVTRPSGGRLRIRKVSSEGGGLNKRRHEAVHAGLVEGEDHNIAGGMF